MSQAGQYIPGGISPIGIVQTLTGDQGGAVGPTANNINVVTDILLEPVTGTATTSIASGYIVTGNPALSIIFLKQYNFEATSINTSVPIWSYTLPTGSSIKVTAELLGTRSDYSGMVSGSLDVGAFNQSGTASLCGNPQFFSEVSDNSIPQPNFGAIVSGNQLVILVSGETGITYNWVANIRYITG